MFVYAVNPGALQTTNAVANTANDCFFMKPGATRTLNVRRMDIVGRGANLAGITGIALRHEVWFTTASSVGTAITPAAKDTSGPAATFTAAFAVATVTSGTGGPLLKGGLGCGGGGPGSWISQDPDGNITIPAAANSSADVFCASAVGSMNFEIMNCEAYE